MTATTRPCTTLEALLAQSGPLNVAVQLQLKPLGVLVRLFVQIPPWRQGDGTQKLVAFEHKLPEKPKAQVQLGVPVLLPQVPPFKQTFVAQVLFC